MWVRVTVNSMNSRRTSAVELHRYAAWYWFLSTAQLFGVTDLLLGLGSLLLADASSTLELLLPRPW